MLIKKITTRPTDINGLTHDIQQGLYDPPSPHSLQKMTALVCLTIQGQKLLARLVAGVNDVQPSLQEVITCNPVF
jgi:hypothetical protein